MFLEPRKLKQIQIHSANDFTTLQKIVLLFFIAVTFEIDDRIHFCWHCINFILPPLCLAQHSWPKLAQTFIYSREKWADGRKSRTCLGSFLFKFHNFLFKKGISRIGIYEILRIFSNRSASGPKRSKSRFDLNLLLPDIKWVRKKC